MDPGKRNIFFLILLAFTGAVGMSLFRPTLPIFTRRMGATGFQVGALTSGFMFTRAMSAYLCGRFSDKIGRRKLFLPLGFFLYIFSCGGLFLARSYQDVLLISIFQGAVSGMMWPMAQVVALESTVRSFKTRALSFYFSSGNAGMSIGNALLGGAIIFIMFKFNTDENTAFRYIYLLSCAVFFIGFVFSLFLSESSRGESVEKATRDSTRRRMSVNLYVILLIGFFIGIVPGLNRSVMVLYLNERFFVPTQNIAFILMAMRITALFAMLVSSYFSDKKGTMRALTAVCVLTGVSAIIIPFVNSIGILVILIVLAGAGARSFTPISRSSVSEISQNRLGQNIGLINTVSNLGAVIGPLVGGFFYDLLTEPFLYVNLNVSILSIVGILILLSISVALLRTNTGKRGRRNLHGV
jgi:DHA1 family multidrug resistance protein-like MFS transporter